MKTGAREALVGRTLSLVRQKKDDGVVLSESGTRSKVALAAGISFIVWVRNQMAALPWSPCGHKKKKI